MADTITSPNMLLPVPIVGQDPGPTYAQDVNNCLTLVDQHNHSSGQGVAITPDGLNISANLPFNGNNATLLRSTRFQSQVTPITASSPDLLALYVSGVDLYYNDGSGNQVRITQSGGVAGSPGSISNLTSPASAAWVSGTSTFVWQSDANTPANMDAASYIFRNLVANSKGLTLAPPNAMASDYTLTLPSIPASTKIMTMNNAGTMSANYDVDNATLEVSSNTLRVKDLGITTAKIAANAVTPAKLSAINLVRSGGSADYTSNSASFVTPTNLSISFTASGLRPVMLVINGDVNVLPANQAIGLDGGAVTASMTISFFRGSTQLSAALIEQATTTDLLLPPTMFSYIDTPSAGTYTYTLQVKTTNQLMHVRNCVLIAYEM